MTRKKWKDITCGVVPGLCLGPILTLYNKLYMLMGDNDDLIFYNRCALLFDSYCFLKMGTKFKTLMGEVQPLPHHFCLKVYNKNLIWFLKKEKKSKEILLDEQRWFMWWFSWDKNRRQS